MISLNLIQAKLGELVPQDWSSTVEQWGELVRLYREYADGNHRAKLTEEMRQMLRISDNRIDQFNSNYCDLVVSTMADRLKVSAMTTDSKEGTVWAETLMRDNRFDGLSQDVHEATIRDGDTFVMVSFDNDDQTPVFVHELAFDGIEGIIPIYDRTRTEIVAAVKVWCWNNVDRYNIYYPDRVEKYSASGAPAEDGTTQYTMKEYEPPANWASVGQVPLIHFKNRARSRITTGISELAAAVPMQDALNRTIVSMVMNAELTAFMNRVAKGFTPPANLTPGSWIVIGAGGLTKDDVVDVDVLKQGELGEFIKQALFLIEQIGTVTRTPLPAFMGGDSSSGEALKQREVGLISKVNKAQVKIGNNWEDAFTLAHKVAQAFARTKPSPVKRFDCRWKDPQVRNDTALIANVVAVADLIGEKWAIKTIAPVFGWSEADVEQIINDKASTAADRLASLGNQIPRFNNFNAPAGGQQPQQGNGQQQPGQNNGQPQQNGAAQPVNGQRAAVPVGR